MNNNLNKSTDVSNDSMDTNNVQSTKNSNKKIFIIFIIVFVIIAILLIVLFFTKFNKPKLLPIVTPSDDVNNNSKYKFDDFVDENAKLTLKDISAYKKIGLNGSMINDKYYFYGQKLYDENGKIILDCNHDFKCEIFADRYFYTNNKLYSLDGKVLMDNINYIDSYDNLLNPFNLNFEDSYLNIDNKLYDLDLKMLFDCSEYEHIDDFNGITIIAYKDKNNYIINTKDNTTHKFYYNFSYGDGSLLLWNQEDKANYYIFNYKTNKLIGPLSYQTKISNNKAIVTYRDTNESFVVDLDDFKHEKFNLSNYGNFDGFLFNAKYIYDSEFIGGTGFMYKLYDNNYASVSDKLYDNITPVDNDYAIFSSGNEHTMVDVNFNEIFKFTNNDKFSLNSLFEYNENVIIYNNENTSAIMDRNGNMIYQGKGRIYNNYNYEHFYFFSESLDDSDKCIYVDSKQKTSKEVDYYFCEYYSWDFLGPFMVKKENDKQHLYNIAFNPVFKNAYDSITFFDKYCIVKNEKYYNVLKYNEEKILNDNFINYYNVGDDKVFLEKEDGSVYYFNYE